MASSQLREVHPLLRGFRQVLHVDDPRLLRDRIRALTKKYAWEIIIDLDDGAKNLTQISEDNRIPYTTVQNRVAELERARLVKVVDTVDAETGRPVKRVTVDDFTIHLTRETIVELKRIEKQSTPDFLR